MAKSLAVYTVIPDFKVGGAKGSDTLEWLESDDADVNMEQAKLDDAISDPGPLKKKWKPYPARYVLADRRPIPADFFKFGSFLAASTVAKEKLSASKDFEWLALDPVDGIPPEFAKKGTPAFFVMRFSRKVIPHPQAKVTYYPGTKSIDEVVSLVLKKDDESDLFAFRLEGDPVTHYATQNLVDLCKREKLKGLEFTAVDCQFK